jgi:speckle-type POZ protein
MWCQSCKEEYEEEDAGTCKECYEEASETEEELKREIDDLRSRLSFLRLVSPTLDAASVPHSDLLLHAIPSCSSSGAGGDGDAARVPDTPAVPAHRVILVSNLSPFNLSPRCLEDFLVRFMLDCFARAVHA